MQKKVKYKIKPVPVAILCAALILMIVGIVALVTGGKDDGNATIDISPVGSQTQSVNSPSQQETVKVSVKIGMGDCILTTDQIIKVTVDVEPSNTDMAVIWKSSDESVMTVTEEGIINAKKTGVAALTATVGNVTDAIVVKWVAPDSNEVLTNQVNPHMGETQVITPLQPVKPGGNQSQGTSQTPSQSQTQNGNQTPAQSQTQSGNQTPTQSQTQSGNQTPTQSQTQNGNQTPTQAQTAKPTTPATKPTTAPTQPATTSPVTPVAPTTAPTQAPTQGISVSEEGLKSVELYTVLPDFGYTRLYSNVYSYGNSKDNYCGQVIIEPNQATIYIANRNTEFDNAVKNVLAVLLPGNSEAVWRSYVGAGSDTTFMVGTRKVRIVTARSGGHSQIVVWN